MMYLNSKLNAQKRKTQKEMFPRTASFKGGGLRPPTMKAKTQPWPMSMQIPFESRIVWISLE